MHPLRYQPDDWAYDLDKWWVPLAELAGQADCHDGTWRTVLGIDEFIDVRLLSQVHLRTPWLCLAAAALAASAARGWALAGADPEEPAAATAKAVALAAFDVAVGLQELRWNGVQLGEDVITSDELNTIGRSSLSASAGLPPAGAPDSLSLAAGWLVHSGGTLTMTDRGAGPSTPAPGHGDAVPVAAAELAQGVLAQRKSAGPIAWGTAHLIERLAAGTMDLRASAPRPDDPPDVAWANVLLVSDRGEVGRFEARRQYSQLRPPSGTPVPDLARLAFTHAEADFLDSISDAFAAAGGDKPQGGPGELISWNLQIVSEWHPLAERTVTGRSAALGAYVAFRSLSELRVFAGQQAAFTGQVSRTGRLGKVDGARWKIPAAAEHGIHLVICPLGQDWQDPSVTVELEHVGQAEDALTMAIEPWRHLSDYLEAACRLVAPEPWLQNWLANQGSPGLQMPLLEIMSRRLHRSPAEDTTDPGPAHDTLRPGGRDIRPGPAHLLARRYPGTSFVITADAGSGCTITAKRMVADAARAAIERMRAIGPTWKHPAVLPLYLPLGTLPPDWDGLVEAAVHALPEQTGSRFNISLALVRALQGDAKREWRALVVTDGTDRVLRPDGGPDVDQVASFVDMITATRREAGRDWWPKHPPQVVLCGRDSPAHLAAAQTLIERRSGQVATVGLDPLSGREIDRFVAVIPGRLPPLAGQARELAGNPLLLAISLIAGRSRTGASGPVDLFDRAIEVLLGDRGDDRRHLAEFAFRAALAKGVPTGNFTLADIAQGQAREQVQSALDGGDQVQAFAEALRPAERDAFLRAENVTHLVTASSGGWRFFHDQAFAFLVADRIARHAVEAEGSDDDHFAVLGQYLGHPLWVDVIEATGRLLELRAAAGGQVGAD